MGVDSDRKEPVCILVFYGFGVFTQILNFSLEKPDLQGKK
jgi:hypothetical protein